MDKSTFTTGVTSMESSIQYNPYRAPQQQTYMDTNVPYIEPNMLYMDTNMSSSTPNFPTQSFPLTKPIAIPQLTPGYSNPYALAYAPILSAYNISCAEFHQFITTLNTEKNKNISLQLVDLSSQIIGFAPEPTTQALSTVASAGAMVGMYYLSKGRTKRVIDEANQGFFGPRGLRVRLCDSEELCRAVGLPEGCKLVEPMRMGGGVDAEVGGISVQERRMRALEPYVSPLTFDVPAGQGGMETMGFGQKLAAWQVRRHLQTEEKSMMKSRMKVAKMMPTADGLSVKEQEKLDKELMELNEEDVRVELEAAAAFVEAEQHRRQKKRDREMAAVEKKRLDEHGKIEMRRRKCLQKAGKDAEKYMKKVEKKDKEIKASKKISWILIENLY
ncbi:MAG: hypothetical protein M1834_006922 [Cirrosporium novae-zelandiae]|nr:MAG: hypothetical protein M1834_006922 [Cirrosporium novae-zelandiae]